MSDRDSALAGCNFKDLWIRNPFELTVGGGGEVDAGSRRRAATTIL